MVNPVVAWAYKQDFKPVGHFFDIPGMYQYAVNLCDGIHQYDVNWFKSYKCQRNKIDETVERLKYR